MDATWKGIRMDVLERVRKRYRRNALNDEGLKAGQVETCPKCGEHPVRLFHQRPCARPGCQKQERHDVWACANVECKYYEDRIVWLEKNPARANRGGLSGTATETTQAKFIAAFAAHGVEITIGEGTGARLRRVHMRIPLLTALAIGAATPAFAVEPACVAAAAHRMFEFLAQEAKGTRHEAQIASFFAQKGKDAMVAELAATFSNDQCAFLVIAPDSTLRALAISMLPERSGKFAHYAPNKISRLRLVEQR